MNKLFASIAFAASALAFASCSNDDPVVEQGSAADDGGKFYATITLSLPEGSRSSTTTPDDNTNSDSGYEVGLPQENAVGSVLVVLASKDDNEKYTCITTSVADAKLTAEGNKNTMPTYSVAFQSEDLLNKAGEKVYVFAYCNPTAALVEAFNGQSGKDFTELIGNIEAGSISGSNAFLMSNKEIVSKDLPEKDDLLATYNTQDKPFYLGPVKVARVTARFDFQPTSRDGILNAYPIYREGSKTVYANIVLDGMALMNEAKEYYYLPRVSADGEDAAINLCGPEYPFLSGENVPLGSYVVSPNVANKKANPLDLSWVKGAYSYTHFTAAGDAIDFSAIDYEAIPAKGDGVQEDNPDDTTWKGPLNKSGYIVWKYVTENTIPGVDNQRKAVTTGIAFRARLEPSIVNQKLKEFMATGKPLYAVNNTIIEGFDELKKMVVAQPNSSIAEGFKAAFGLENLDDLDSKDLDETKLNGSHGITVYRSTKVGEKYVYYMYYAYYNRHNDNDNNTVMGPMEFAVVRNNVYKLYVDNINTYGHPGDPKDDPDPEKPGDPDESPKTYFTVDVKVVPWVVRVNKITL
ncbi:MAG: Mfa1 family fimbria major subunit [Lachnospiraceae bacterium]|nr:Mfa1 family fimbria major subunit [Lachnospiraceae bacterium]